MDEKRALIESLLESAGVSPTELWRAREVLSIASEDQLIELARLLAEDPKAGHTLIDHTLRKVRALATEDTQAWEQILQEEKTALLAA